MTNITCKHPQNGYMYLNKDFQPADIYADPRKSEIKYKLNSRTLKEGDISYRLGNSFYYEFTYKWVIRHDKNILDKLKILYLIYG